MSQRLAFVARACGLCLVPCMAIAACSVQTADQPSPALPAPEAGSSGSDGGHSGSSPGGSAGAGGSSFPVGGVSGSNTSGGSGTGAGGGAGSSGMAGAQSVQPQVCVNPPPAKELITDFSTNYTGDLNAWAFGDSSGGMGFYGGGYVYPAAPNAMAISADLSQGNLHVTGTIATSSGFGLWFATCSDAQAFKGISFKIGGNVGVTKMLKFSIQTNADQAIDPVNKKGACAYTTGTVNYTPDCTAPSTQIDVSETGGVVTVPFDLPTGGKPVGSVNPHELLGIQFEFAAPAVPYDVDVKLDDVRFYGGMDDAGPPDASMPK